MNEPLRGNSRTLCAVYPLRPHGADEVHVLESVTVVLGGRHLGTFMLDAPYAGSEPLRLYVVKYPRRDEHTAKSRADCLITDSDLG